MLRSPAILGIVTRPTSLYAVRVGAWACSPSAGMMMLTSGGWLGTPAPSRVVAFAFRESTTVSEILT